MATFRTRTGRNGDKSVQVMVRRAGFPTLTETFPTKKLAEQWANIQEAGILEGKVSKDAAGRKRTIAEAITKFRAEVLPLMKDGSMYGFTLDWWNTNHGSQKLGEVSRSWLSDVRAELLAGKYRRATPGSKRSTIKVVQIAVSGGCIPGDMQAPTYQRTPATTNRYMAALSSVFSKACGDWEWLQPGANPFLNFGKLAEGKNKGKAYADYARQRLLQEARQDPQLHRLIRVALGTAARAGELLALTWSHVEMHPATTNEDMNGKEEPAYGRLMLVDTKNGDTRIAWLFGDALEAVKEQMAHFGLSPEKLIPSDLSKPVFPGQWSHKHQRYGRYAYLKPLHAALKRAGLTMRRPFHALRHTAATQAARMGANKHQLAGLGGWKSNAVDTYIHLAGQDSKPLAQELAKRLAGSTQESK